MKLHVYRDKAGGWRWHLHARNGKLICTAGEAFSKHGNALRAARRMLSLLPPGSVRLVEDERH